MKNKSIISQYLILQILFFCVIYFFFQHSLSKSKLTIAHAIVFTSKTSILNNDLRKTILNTNLINQDEFKYIRFIGERETQQFLIPSISIEEFNKVMTDAIWLNTIKLNVDVGEGNTVGSYLFLYNRFEHFFFSFLAWIFLIALSIPFLLRALKRTRELAIVEAEVEQEYVKINLAKQLAHDIRSPLAALDMGIKSLKGASSTETQLIRSAINRIHDIANNLSGKKEGLNSDTVLHPTLLPSLIASIVSEKRTEFRDKSNVDIDFSFSANNYGLFSSVIPAELKRVCSNLVNNSVEAIGESRGEIKICLERFERVNAIHIADNGCGINPENLGELFAEGFSSGKSDGTGIGLFHAKRVIESWGGKLEVESVLGEGATFKIILPDVQAPNDFVASLKINQKNEVVIVDDDSSIHQVWKGRFQSLGLNDIRISTFSSPRSFLDWVKDNQSEEQVYLIDYEFLGSDINGLDILKEVDSRDTYLITSRFEEDHIKVACQRMQIPLVDKGMIGFIPIETTEKTLKVVFIDDDPIMHLGWQMEAKSFPIELHCFKSVEEFIKVSDQFSQKSPVFIDSNLGEEIKGEVESKKIFDLGFSQIYLATGYAAKDIEKPDWIVGVRGKKPDFDKLFL